MTNKKTQQSNESVATYEPKEQSGKRFVQKHFDDKNRPMMAPGHEEKGGKDYAGNEVESFYRGATKVAARPGHGYAAAPSDEDEKVYEGKSYRHSDNSKHKSRASVKQFLNRKKQRDARRLGEEAELAAEAAPTRGPGSLNDPDHPANSAHSEWVEHATAISKTLSKIDGLVKQHMMAVTKPYQVHGTIGAASTVKNVSGKANWSHAETLKKHRRELEDLHDKMAGKGEYTQPSLSGLQREETEQAGQQINEDDSGLDLATVRKKMMAANKVHVLGIKHKDPQMQQAAKERLRQLAKHHARLSEEALPEGIEELIAEPTLSEKFVEAVGDELAAEIMAAHEHLDDEGKETLLGLIKDEQWEQLADLFKDEE